MNGPHSKLLRGDEKKPSQKQFKGKDHQSQKISCIWVGGKKERKMPALQMSHPPSSAAALSEEEEETDLGPAAGPSLTDPAGG